MSWVGIDEALNKSTPKICFEPSSINQTFNKSTLLKVFQLNK